MIREKGEALSPVKINRNVWSNSAARVKGLFTVSGAPLGLQPTGLRPARGGGCEREKEVRKEKTVIKIIKRHKMRGKNNKKKRLKETRWQSQCKYCGGRKPETPPDTVCPYAQVHTHTGSSFSLLHSPASSNTFLTDAAPWGTEHQSSAPAASASVPFHARTDVLLTTAQTFECS